MNPSKSRLNRILPSWTYKWIILLIGVVMIAFNDVWGRADRDKFLLCMFLYALLIVFLILRWIFQQVRGNIILKKEQKNMELRHLQSQVNPHFFFNMLNNLYGWVEKDPKVAKGIILNMSDMMRYSIYEGQKEYVTVEEEIAYLQKYIDLHKSRYRKTIQIGFIEDVDDPATLVMPLLFIILLENAFKHGVENLRENAFINISLKCRDGQLRFTVENNFDPTIDDQPQGIGLHNLKRRLELAYPERHNLDHSIQDNIYKADLIIELR